MAVHMADKDVGNSTRKPDSRASLRKNFASISSPVSADNNNVCHNSMVYIEPENLK